MHAGQGSGGDAVAILVDEAIELLQLQDLLLASTLASDAGR